MCSIIKVPSNTIRMAAYPIKMIYEVFKYYLIIFLLLRIHVGALVVLLWLFSNNRRYGKVNAKNKSFLQSEYTTQRSDVRTNISVN